MNRNRFVAVLCMGIAAITPAFGSSIVFSNFGPGGTFNTNASLIAATQAIGAYFTPSSDVQFLDAQLPMMTAGGGTTAKVYLLADNAGRPGAILDTLVQQGTIGFLASIVTYNCVSCGLLTAGNLYWIVAAVGDGNTGWLTNIIGDLGPQALSSGSVNGPWTLTGSSAHRPAFQVDGNVLAPEPGSMTMLGSALFAIGLALCHRRRRSAKSLLMTCSRNS